MKRTVSILILICTALMLLASCGAAGSGAYSFKANGVTLTPNAKAKDAISALGEPLSYDESPSCAFEGLDKVYVYSSFTLYTYPEKGTDYILKISISNDSVATDKGIRIGSTKSAVKEAYGNGVDGTNTLTYTAGKTKLEFVFNGETVKNINYVAITD